MPIKILDDDEIREIITPTLAVESMRNAIRAHGDGSLSAPPRIRSQLKDVALDFTTGELSGQWFGYRSNAISEINGSEQIIALQDFQSGRAKALAIGHTLGPYRTGAIGAVAVDCLAPKSASTLAVLGSGPQAWAQLWAISAVRELEKISVYSPNDQRRKSFVDRAKSELGLNVIATQTARQAVEGHQIIVIATNSSTPVLDAKWLNENVHINTLGNKFRDNSEFGLDVLGRCRHSFTDSLDQLAAYRENLIFDPLYLEKVVPLSSVIVDPVAQKNYCEEPTIFLSVGLAGTELFLLDSLLNTHFK